MQGEVGITSFAKRSKEQAKCSTKRAKRYFGGFKKQKNGETESFLSSSRRECLKMSERVVKIVGEFIKMLLLYQTVGFPSSSFRVTTKKIQLEKY